MTNSPPPPFNFSLSPFTWRQARGFSLIEVMFAMVILAYAIMGAMGMFQWAERGLQQGARGIRALALVESRLDAKRTVPWSSLLRDDIDGDGVAEILMRDDGAPPDATGGDGVFTASREVGGIRLVWTLEPDRTGPLREAASATLSVRGSYRVWRGLRREIRLGTMRANPRYYPRDGVQ